MLCLQHVLQYVVLTADSLGDLLSKNATRVIWCGWRNIISEPNVCQMVLSPMKDTYFAVEPKQSGLLSIGRYLGLVCHGQWACLDYAMDVSKGSALCHMQQVALMQVALDASELREPL